MVSCILPSAFISGTGSSATLGGNSVLVPSRKSKSNSRTPACLFSFSIIISTSAFFAFSISSIVPFSGMISDNQSGCGTDGSRATILFTKSVIPFLDGSCCEVQILHHRVRRRNIHSKERQDLNVLVEGGTICFFALTLALVSLALAFLRD